MVRSRSSVGWRKATLWACRLYPVSPGRGCAFAFDRRDRSAAGDVEGIADERVTEGRRVNSNLVWAARDDGDLDEGVAGFGVDVKATAFAARGATIGCGGVESTDGRVVDGADGCVDDECVR